MARPRKYDRQQVVEKVLERFWTSGFQGTSMEQIDADTAMRRGSIYNAFGDKRSLYIEALDHYGALQFGAAKKIFDHADSTPKAVQTLFGGALDLANEQDVRKGCFVCNSAVELAQNDEEIADRVQYYLNTLTHAIRQSLDKTYPTLDVQSGQSHQMVAEQLTSSYMGFNVMLKAGIAVSTLKRLVESAVAAATLV